MSKTVRQEVVDAIIEETVRSLPESILGFYRELPGRRPSDRSQKIARIIGELGDDDALMLMRDVVDASVFALLSLFDAEFKDKNIAVRFDRDTALAQPAEDFLLDVYRQCVDPGGEVVDQVS